jgi:hypothetical protein
VSAPKKKNLSTAIPCLPNRNLKFYNLKFTIKAFNLGLHVNFEIFFFQKGLLSSNRFPQKNGENESQRKALNMQT